VDKDSGHKIQGWIYNPSEEMGSYGVVVDDDYPNRASSLGKSDFLSKGASPSRNDNDFARGGPWEVALRASVTASRKGVTWSTHRCAPGITDNQQRGGNQSCGGAEDWSNASVCRGSGVGNGESGEIQF